MMTKTARLISLATALILAALLPAASLSGTTKQKPPKPVHPRRHVPAKPKPRPTTPTTTPAQLQRAKDRAALTQYLVAVKEPRRVLASSQSVISSLPDLPTTPDASWLAAADTVKAQVDLMTGAYAVLKAITPPPRLSLAHVSLLKAWDVSIFKESELEKVLRSQSIDAFTSWASGLAAAQAGAKQLKDLWQAIVVAEGQRIGIAVVFATVPYTAPVTSP